MDDILATAAQKAGDLFIYIAIAAVFLIGLFKCIMSTQRVSRALQKSVRQLEKMTLRKGSQPIWQDPLFLGRTLETSWRRFLVNAEQLDSRGINCNVEDYVNDDSVIYAHCHTQLGEVIPGMLTSLGILGTFMGLVQGLGALDLSNAANTINGISDMISGMNFAFGTSIAGCIASILFNILNHAAIGSAQHSIDDFHESFAEFVMQQPLSDNVQSICQQEDRAAFLRQAVNDIGVRLSEGVASAVNASMIPISQSINTFISGETQHQIEGLNIVVNRFIENMNQSLGSQFVQLGQTLSAINTSCQVDREAMNNSMAAATNVLQSMQQMSDMMLRVSNRLQLYTDEAAEQRDQGQAFTQGMQNVLGSMHGALQEQEDYLRTLRSQQAALENQMRDYSNWSARVLQTVDHQTIATAGAAEKTAASMREASKALSESYASFADNITNALSRSFTQFEKNMQDAAVVLNSGVAELGRSVSAADSSITAKSDDVRIASDGIISSLSRIQRALQDITDQMNAVTREGA